MHRLFPVLFFFAAGWAAPLVAAEAPSVARVANGAIQVEFSSPDTLVWWGQPVRVNFLFENTGEEEEDFEVWLALWGDGAVYFDNPIGGPFPLTMAPGDVSLGSAEVTIPTDFSLADVSLCLEAGVFGEDAWDIDCADFRFESPLSVEFLAVEPNVRRGDRVQLEYAILNRQVDAPVTFKAAMNKYLIGGQPADNPVWGPQYFQADFGGGYAGNAAWPVGEFAEIGGPYELCLVIEPRPYMRQMTTCVEYYVEP